MEKIIQIGLTEGLHAKTAGAFVHEASQFKSDVHLKKGFSVINAKSILGLMSIVLHAGDEVTLTATGDDEEEALKQLSALLEGDRTS
ncbi:phosphotransferase system HPr (HPr) family protein [Alkalihalobacillus xiaoxiensis]|uniref:Phosphotransferase system HPr (HPr) family protein n=1 Tax=Shouchella xiaoxiensis TaxID=766895 RepID=A0ABS2T0H3_9BACI|nr:HPr family phosphocarrier protein [Shouchella xiaoxiensis]MBM7839982.1 phosphotransferase system HPr (HPr) family protein [Shouchella xiaoxiensis]